MQGNQFRIKLFLNFRNFSDNCNEADACRRAIIDILNRSFPIQGTREPVKCSAHVFARSEHFWMALFKVLRKFIELVTQVFGPSSRNLSDVWVNTYGNDVKMKTTRGVRWFSPGFEIVLKIESCFVRSCTKNHDFESWYSLFYNCDIAIRNWDKLIKMLNDHRSRSTCQELLELINEHEKSLLEDLLSTALTGRCLSDGFWKDLTRHQKKREFLEQIKKLTSFKCKVEDSENILETYSRFFRSSENDQLSNIYGRVGNKNVFVRHHKKNFISIVNYLIKSMKPNDYANLESSIGILNIIILV